MTAFCLRAIEISGMFLDPNFVKFVCETYENVKYFNNMNLNRERGKLTDFVGTCRILFFENFE